MPEGAALEILCQLKDREPQPVRALAAQFVSVSPTRASRLVQDLIDAGSVPGVDYHAAEIGRAHV